MKVVRSVWFKLFVLLAFVGLMAQQNLLVRAESTSELPPVNLNTEQAGLARELKGEVMAPCCWHGTVDHHNSPVAAKIGHQIESMVAEGKTRQQVLDAIVVEYGERILARPRTEGFGLWFYVAPSVAVIGAGLLLARWVRRNAAPSTGDAGVGGTVAPSKPAGPVSDEWGNRFEEQLKRQDS